MRRFHIALLGLVFLGCSTVMGGQAANDCIPRDMTASSEPTTRLVAGGRGVAARETTSAAAVGGASSDQTLAAGGRGVPFREETSNFGSRKTGTAPSSHLVAGPPGTPVRVECR